MTYPPKKLATKKISEAVWIEVDLQSQVAQQKRPDHANTRAGLRRPTSTKINQNGLCPKRAKQGKLSNFLRLMQGLQDETILTFP
jgi:hypothetical protein